jgi:hypothetical protein
VARKPLSSKWFVLVRQYGEFFGQVLDAVGRELHENWSDQEDFRFRDERWSRFVDGVVDRMKTLPNVALVECRPGERPFFDEWVIFALKVMGESV